MLAQQADNPALQPLSVLNPINNTLGWDGGMLQPGQVTTSDNGPNQELIFTPTVWATRRRSVSMPVRRWRSGWRPSTQPPSRCDPDQLGDG